MRKQSVFIATSLDGFIARPNGDIDWLIEDGEPEDDYGYSQFAASIDVLVMGRHTFKKALSFGEWPYKGPVIVLSSSAIDVPKRLHQVQQLSGSPAEIIDHLAGKGFGHLYIDGGKTIQQFLRSGFIQEITITRIPILIGEGIPLFGTVEKDIRLEHLSTKTYQNGFVQSRYRIIHYE